MWLEERIIGEVTLTQVGIMYIKGIANDEIVQEVRNRLGRIKIDGILESGYIEDLIQDGIWTPFPTVFNSERPDVIAAGLLEGRVAVLVDGTPFVLLVPVMFNSFLQAAEDYYQRFDFGNFFANFAVCFFVNCTAPSFAICCGLNLPSRNVTHNLNAAFSGPARRSPFPAYHRSFYDGDRI